MSGGCLSKHLDEGSCSFCSIHSFLCNCGVRMERLDRLLTSEGCNTFSMAQTSGKAQCAPYYKNTITSTSVYSYYKSLPSKSLTITFMWRLPIREMHPGGSLFLFLLLQCYYYYYYYYCYYCYYFYFYYITVIANITFTIIIIITITCCRMN